MTITMTMPIAMGDPIWDPMGSSKSRHGWLLNLSFQHLAAFSSKYNGSIYKSGFNLCLSRMHEKQLQVIEG